MLTADSLLGGSEETLSPEERLRRERMRLLARGISSFQLSPNGAYLLIPLSGRLFLVDRLGNMRVEELPLGDSSVIDPRFSPDCRYLGYVKAGALHVFSLATRVEKRISPLAREGITYGTAEYAAQEEMTRFEGYWFTQDSGALLFQETDDRALETLTLADPGRPHAEPERMPYPRAGQTNSSVRLGLVNLSDSYFEKGESKLETVATGASTSSSSSPASTVGVWTLEEASSALPLATRWFSLASTGLEYLATVRWIDSSALALLLQSRDQQYMKLVEVDIVTGAMRTLLEERDDKFLNLDQTVPRFVDSGARFLWSTESGGVPALQLRSRKTGEVEVVLTDATVAYRSLITVQGGVAFVKGGPNSADEMVYGIPLPATSSSPPGQSQSSSPVLTAISDGKAILSAVNSTWALGGSASSTSSSEHQDESLQSQQHELQQQQPQGGLVPHAFLLAGGRGNHSAVFPSSSVQVCLHSRERLYGPPVYTFRSWSLPKVGTSSSSSSSFSSATTTTSRLGLGDGAWDARQGVFVRVADAFANCAGEEWSDEDDGADNHQAARLDGSASGEASSSSSSSDWKWADDLYNQYCPSRNQPCTAAPRLAVTCLGKLTSEAETPWPRGHLQLLGVTGKSGRRYHCATAFPRDFVPGKKYPVIVYVYGGPCSRVVNTSAFTYHLHHLLASAGFIAVSFDNRGTPYRGRDWGCAIRHDFISAPCEDQVEALQALAAEPFFSACMDMSRVGVYGWSFGGFFSSFAGMVRPDVYKVCVAGAPVSDWNLYDTHCTY